MKRNRLFHDGDAPEAPAAETPNEVPQDQPQAENANGPVAEEAPASTQA